MNTKRQLNTFVFPTDRRMKVEEWRKLAVLWRRWFGGVL